MVEPPPDPKRQRLDEEDPDEGAEALDAAAEADGIQVLFPADLDADETTLADYASHQDVLDKVTEECSNRILAIEYEYAQKKRAHLQQRSEVLRKIPQFWKKVLYAHPSFRPYFTDADLAVLDYLQEVDYDDSLDPSRTGWKIRFLFAENPFFENTEVVKEFKYPDESSPLVSVCTELRWRPGKAPMSEEAQAAAAAGSKRPAPENDYNFISNWLKGEPDGVYNGQDPLSELLKEEIWPNPMAVLTAAADAAAEEGEGLEDEEGFEEEGEEIIEIDVEDDEDELQEYEEGAEGFEEGDEPLEGEEGYQEGADDQGGTGDEFDEGEEPAEGDNDEAEPEEGV